MGDRWVRRTSRSASTRVATGRPCRRTRREGRSLRSATSRSTMRARRIRSGTGWRPLQPNRRSEAMANEAYRAVFLRVHPTRKMVLSLTTAADGNEPQYAELVAHELGVPALDVKVVP